MAWYGAGLGLVWGRARHGKGYNPRNAMGDKIPNKVTGVTTLFWGCHTPEALILLGFYPWRMTTTQECLIRAKPQKLYKYMNENRVFRIHAGKRGLSSPTIQIQPYQEDMSAIRVRDGMEQSFCSVFHIRRI